MNRSGRVQSTTQPSPYFKPYLSTLQVTRPLLGSSIQKTSIQVASSTSALSRPGCSTDSSRRSTSFKTLILDIQVRGTRSRNWHSADARERSGRRYATAPAAEKVRASRSSSDQWRGSCPGYSFSKHSF
ncbi:hypothetical protein ACFX13_007634 [Malus domestica]